MPTSVAHSEGPRTLATENSRPALSGRRPGHPGALLLGWMGWLSALTAGWLVVEHVYPVGDHFWVYSSAGTVLTAGSPQPLATLTFVGPSRTTAVPLRLKMIVTGAE